MVSRSTSGIFIAEFFVRPLLFEEEAKKRIDEGRKIARLPRTKQGAAYDAEEARHKVWVEEYVEKMDKEKELPLHDKGALFREKVLCRWYLHSSFGT